MLKSGIVVTVWIRWVESDFKNIYNGKQVINLQTGERNATRQVRNGDQGLSISE